MFVEFKRKISEYVSVLINIAEHAYIGLNVISIFFLNYDQIIIIIKKKRQIE